MEPRRKKTVQLMIDGRGPFTLHLQLGRFENDDELAIDLVTILARAIQRRPCEGALRKIHWDKEKLRERDKAVRQLVKQIERFGRNPNGARIVARRHTSHERTLEQPKEA